ncbi:COG1525 Micrococcal nuclease (thermonuclease) homologs [uncultured Caudovirales phage]|uniref:COG1525 Micrococcal nuclease (Thermonuclease) homologs n=1 Tax=uncultured Caudovirales phage TaxID=2100421 RepID=A0A6J5NPA0_9CAUD|nr:COG1525 Micrococcal nuclease (thermonuclease) homologs [uncultured Caudovirales phage]
MYTYNAKLIRVVDGDTIIAMIDLGFHTWTEKIIRLHGIDAYESRTKDLKTKEKGVNAKLTLSRILEGSNGVFTLESKGIDKYGRSLGIAYVTLTDINTELNINDHLVNEGLAVRYDGGTKTI